TDFYWTAKEPIRTRPEGGKPGLDPSTEQLVMARSAEDLPRLLGPRRMELLQEYQRAYADYIHTVANLPQQAFDEVAQMIVEGNRAQCRVNLDPTRVMLMKAKGTDERYSRFGFTRLEGPFKGPMTMEDFLTALLVEDPQHETPADAITMLKGASDDLKRQVS